MNIYRLNCYKHILLLVLALTPILELKAQEVEIPKSEISGYIKGPFAKLSFDVGDYGETNGRSGIGLGAQYAHYIDINWSISAGLEYQSYHSEAIFDSFSDSYATTDIEGDDFEFQYSVSSYKERENLSLLNIPIKVQYEKALKEEQKLTFYGSAGFSIGFPVVQKYKSKASDLQTAGYYPQWDALLTSPQFMGFGDWGDQHTNKMKLDTKTSFAFLLETGIKHDLESGHRVYAGIFADIPLNRINKTSGNPTSLVAYNASNPTELTYNPVINSAPGAQENRYADKMKPVAFGIKLRYAFAF